MDHGPPRTGGTASVSADLVPRDVALIAVADDLRPGHQTVGGQATGGLDKIKVDGTIFAGSTIDATCQIGVPLEI